MDLNTSSERKFFKIRGSCNRLKYLLGRVTFLRDQYSMALNSPDNPQLTQEKAKKMILELEDIRRFIDEIQSRCDSDLQMKKEIEQIRNSSEKTIKGLQFFIEELENESSQSYNIYSKRHIDKNDLFRDMMKRRKIESELEIPVSKDEKLTENSSRLFQEEKSESLENFESQKKCSQKRKSRSRKRRQGVEESESYSVTTENNLLDVAADVNNNTSVVADSRDWIQPTPFVLDSDENVKRPNKKVKNAEDSTETRQDEKKTDRVVVVNKEQELIKTLSKLQVMDEDMTVGQVNFDTGIQENDEINLDDITYSQLFNPPGESLIEDNGLNIFEFSYIQPHTINEYFPERYLEDHFDLNHWKDFDF